ncbi:protein restricted tev movement [Anaeramoeba flamelloides]|uniref:Protein restricted tev movement n=1 Tax=Anaeramoeba flamelloides TaxID=1746091 RepID=A0AAV7Y920_9EUKA|nr:protein restricted tev movement [Anaeramoeba flamelloides]
MLPKKKKAVFDFAIVSLSNFAQKNQTVVVNWKIGKSNGKTQTALLNQNGFAEWNQEFRVNCLLKKDTKNKKYKGSFLTLTIQVNSDKKHSKGIKKQKVIVAKLKINPLQVRFKSLKDKPISYSKIDVLEKSLTIKNERKHSRLPVILISTRLTILNNEENIRIPKQILNDTKIVQKLEQFDQIRRQQQQTIDDEETYSELTEQTPTISENEEEDKHDDNEKEKENGKEEEEKKKKNEREKKEDRKEKKTKKVSKEKKSKKGSQKEKKKKSQTENEQERNKNDKLSLNTFLNDGETNKKSDKQENIHKEKGKGKGKEKEKEKKKKKEQNQDLQNGSPLLTEKEISEIPTNLKEQEAQLEKQDKKLLEQAEELNEMQTVLSYSKKLHLEKFLIQRVLLLSEAIYSNGYPLPSCLIFKSLLYCKAFEIREISISIHEEHKREDLLDCYLNSIRLMLPSIKDNKDSLFWLISNIVFMQCLVENTFSKEMNNENKENEENNDDNDENEDGSEDDGDDEDKKEKKKEEDSDVDEDSDEDSEEKEDDDDDEDEVEEENINEKNKSNNSIEKINYFRNKLFILLSEILQMLTQTIFRNIKQHIIISYLINNEENYEKFKKRKKRKKDKNEQENVKISSKRIVRNELYSLLTSVRANYLPAEISNIVFKQLLYSINGVLINTLLKRKRLCTAGNGIRIKLAIALLREWLISVELKDLTNELNPIQQLVECLQLNKVILKSRNDNYQACKDVCPDLSLLLISKILENVQPDEFDTDPIPKDDLSKFKKNVLKLIISKKDMQSDCQIDLNHFYPINLNLKKIQYENWDRVQVPKVIKQKKEFGFLSKTLKEILNNDYKK